MVTVGSRALRLANVGLILLACRHELCFYIMIATRLVLIYLLNFDILQSVRQLSSRYVANVVSPSYPAEVAVVVAVVLGLEIAEMLVA